MQEDQVGPQLNPVCDEQEGVPVYGKKAGVPFVAKGPFLAFFGGASGGDQIGSVSTGTSPRLDRPAATDVPTPTISMTSRPSTSDYGDQEIRIWLGDYRGPVICSFQVTYRLSDGTFHEALRHGRTGSEIFAVEI